MGGGDDDRLPLLLLPLLLWFAITADTAAASDDEGPSEWRGGKRPDGASGPITPFACNTVGPPPSSVGGEDEYEDEAVAAVTMAAVDCPVEAEVK